MEINLFENYKEPILFAYREVVSAVGQYFVHENPMSLILVDADEIKTLNHQYRGINQVTDVLSFSVDDEDYLGDVFICIDRVLSQAEEYNHTAEREFAFLLVHGILHLLGYMHEDEATEREMFEKQEAILQKLNYRREKDESKI